MPVVSSFVSRALPSNESVCHTIILTSDTTYRLNTESVIKQPTTPWYTGFVNKVIIKKLIEKYTFCDVTLCSPVEVSKHYDKRTVAVCFINLKGFFSST
jgi:hypothetical protein